MKIELLRDLLDTYAHKGSPKYISNLDLMEYFKSKKSEIDFHDFSRVRDYFLNELKVTRYAFTEISAWFKDNSPGSDKERDANSIEPPGMERFREALVLKRYSRKTVKAYLGALRRANAWFVREKGISADRICTGNAREYFLYLTAEKGVSVSLVRMHRFALASYFKIVMDRELDERRPHVAHRF
ncbi:MAG: hypothetical protein EPN93_21130 [Spirochaetes bacterium]|nr:MAG: hypothetical protein EPN93_21130 [Spirochaetota bacterium]